MRVLHWFPNYFHGGGVANAIHGLAAAQADAGDAVAIAGVDDDTQPLYGRQPGHDGVTLFRWRPRATVNVGTLTIRPPSRPARTKLREWKPDVVHIHAEFAPDNLWATLVFDCPTVLTFHGALHPEVFRKGKRATKQLYVALARRSLYRRVDRFVALCPAEASHIGRVLPGRPIDTIPLGPGRSVGTITANGIGVTRETRSRGVQVVSIGRLDVYTKGLDLLVAAFARANVCLDGRLERLTFVGPDWRDGKRMLEEQVRRIGLSGSVSFAGSVGSAAVGQFLADADVYAQLSRHDAFPLSVVDALASGLPAVLSSSVGTTSYREVMAMPNVRVTPPEVDAAGSALAQLVVECDQGRFNRAEAAATARDLFSWSRVAAAHAATYRAAVG